MPKNDALAVVDAIPRDELPALLVRVAARMTALAGDATPDDLLTPDETAALVRANRKWVYRHAEELGAVRMSRRKLCFSRRRVLRWVARK